MTNGTVMTNYLHLLQYCYKLSTHVTYQSFIVPSILHLTSKYRFNINLRQDNWMFQKCFDILMTILIKKPIFKMWFQQHFCQS